MTVRYAPGRFVLFCLLVAAHVSPAPAGTAAAEGGERNRTLLDQLDTPLLFVKRLNYLGIHIYDTYYKWRPGGGIYVLENPSAPPAEHRTRPVIDPTTPETLGTGIYSDPELSWDATRLLFCYKPSPKASTSIYEIGVDGKGLRRLTDPDPYCAAYKGRNAGSHDVAPAYLPDGRIVFLSTRPNGLVPCNNTGIAILHVMNADGSDIHSISVNNVNEFDPCVLPDGRILFGRWEYVDKTALTQQSLWTVFPDGTNETALFANNMVHPEALLDARPVPGALPLVVASFTRHNSPPRGKVGFVDTWLAKNGAQALFNLEDHPRPTVDTGQSCEPWPLSRDVILYSGRPRGHKFNAIMIIDRAGHQAVVCADPKIDCHSPIPIRPQLTPPVIAPNTRRDERAGRFFVQDVYQGLTGVKRGEVKWLRVIEETVRTSPSPGGALNQTFLMSAVLAWSAKNFLGVTQVESDGSAYFEVPSGRAVYLQALDGEGRLIRSMRTFVQAAPGVTRSCIGCHEYKFSAPASAASARARKRGPQRLRSESWGSGFIDYPSMVQPILDKHCVRCHGGQGGLSASLDLTGGWTEYFSISYENLVSRRETQLVAHLISGIDCMNGTSYWSAKIFPPRFHGSGAAPLAGVLVNGDKGHEKRFTGLSRPERDLLLAWIDTNGLYHGTWDYTGHGCSLKAWGRVRGALMARMQKAACARCHGDGKRIPRFESDWFNLERPELSRILRAPLAEGKKGFGLALCRDRKVDPRRQRVHLLRTGRYVHGAEPLEKFKPQPAPPPSPDGGRPVVSFASTDDPHYRAMLDIIRDGRRQALAAPRVDMPGADVQPGSFRQSVPPPLPDPLPALAAKVVGDGIVELSWPRSAQTIGLAFEVHRGSAPGFEPTEKTRLHQSHGFLYADAQASTGRQHYALLVCSGPVRSTPCRATITVPEPAPPPVPAKFVAEGEPGQVALAWQSPGKDGLRYNVYRAKAGSETFEKITDQPVGGTAYFDTDAAPEAAYAYAVRCVSRRGTESDATPAVTASALPVPKEAVFTAPFGRDIHARLATGAAAKGRVHGGAAVADGVLDLRGGGHVTFGHRPEFDLARPLTVECWVRFDRASQMPVIVSCGKWQGAGWFLQGISGGWRWYCGGVNCDGGKSAVGRWTHLATTFDGRRARVYQDGREVASAPCRPDPSPWPGPLFVGQYGPAPGPQYQVAGRIAGLKLYRRALSVEEAAAAFKAGPPAGK